MWFPLSSLNKYLEIFNNINVNVEIIDNKEAIIKEILKLNLNDLTKEELIFIIERFIRCI